MVTLFAVSLSTNIVGPLLLKTLASISLKEQISIFIIIGILYFCALATRIITWMKILSRVKLSIAYPVVSITFPIMLFISYQIYNEEITISKLCGTGMIILGLVLNRGNN